MNPSDKRLFCMAAMSFAALWACQPAAGDALTRLPFDEDFGAMAGRTDPVGCAAFKIEPPRGNGRETSASARLEHVGGVSFENNEFKIQEGSRVPSLCIADGVEDVALKGNRVIFKSKGDEDE